jgi:glycosyltransferase involved in cell wall biosynthesis
MSHKDKVLLVYSSYSSFVNQDYEILSRHYIVEKFCWQGKKDILRLFRAVKRCDVTFSWFAADHAAVTVFFSRLLGKSSIVVVGGYDVAYVPELNYGRFTQSKLKRMLTCYALKKSDIVLVVSQSLKDEAINNFGIDGRNILYLPTGYESRYWRPSGKKEDMVLTVASANDMVRIKLKGLDTFVETAKLLPEIPFVVVGVSGNAKNYLKGISPANVKLVGFLTHDELLKYYQKAKIYCQLSLREGLPNCLCEAMLCECIPIGTIDVGGIRDAIGETGFYVGYGNSKDVAEAIRMAFKTQKNGKGARNRIMVMFPESRREDGLIKVINRLISSQKQVK